MSVLAVPSRRIRGIGSFSRLGGMADDDSKVLIAASTDDLLTLGRIFTAYRKIASQKMGGYIGQLKPILDMVNAVRGSLVAAGLAPDQSTMDAVAAMNDFSKNSSDGVQHIPALDGFLDGIANILTTRQPGWQVGYTKYADGSLVNVVSRSGPEDLKQVSLDFEGTSLWDCVGFVYKNREILGRLKKGAGLSAAGGLLIVVIILIVALTAVIALLTLKAGLMKSVETKRLEEALRKNVEQIALNTSTINQKQNQLADLNRIPPEERTNADNAQMAALMNDIAKLQAENRGLEAQKAEIAKGLDSIRASEDILDKLGSTLSTGFSYLIYGGVGIILVGIVLWIWRPFK